MTCSTCKQPTHTGIDINTGQCWICQFPRKNILPLTEEQRELIALSWEDRK